MHGEEYNLSDVGCPAHDHGQSIYSAAPARCRRHTIFQCTDKVQVIPVQLIIFLSVLELRLLLERLGLSHCIVLLGVGIY